MKKTLMSCGILVLGLALAPAPAGANIGLYFGTGAGWTFPNGDGEVMDLLEPGTGFAWEMVHLGYNFTDFWGVSMQLGGVSGPGKDILGHDTYYSQSYITFNLRYSFTPLAMTVPYLEAGLGEYMYFMEGDDGDFDSDPALGARVALGANFYLGNLYLCPELSYHWVEYDEGDLSMRYWGAGPVEFEERADMMLFLVKVGYHFRI